MATRSVFVAALALLAMAGLCAAADAPSKGPTRIAAGEGFAIHCFGGAVQDHWVLGRVTRAGMVVAHTDLTDGTVTWLVRTGTMQIPTARVSYATSRLVGLLQTDKHLVAVVYASGRMFDRAEDEPAAEKGTYRLMVFEKRTGKTVYTTDVAAKESGLSEIPAETTEAGLLQKTEDGFSVFSVLYVFTADGVEKKGAAERAGAEKTGAN